MGPALHDAALIDDVDHIRLLNGTEPMGDCDRGTALRRRVQRDLNYLLRLRVERRCGFVQEENFRVAQEGARDRDPLLLPAREEGAFGADDGGEALARKKGGLVLGLKMRALLFAGRGDAYGNDRMKS